MTRWSQCECGSPDGKLRVFASRGVVRVASVCDECVGEGNSFSILDNATVTVLAIEDLLRLIERI